MIRGVESAFTVVTLTIPTLDELSQSLESTSKAEKEQRVLLTVFFSLKQGIPKPANGSLNSQVRLSKLNFCPKSNSLLPSHPPSA
jgi:hypothetical protein